MESELPVSMAVLGYLVQHPQRLLEVDVRPQWFPQRRQRVILGLLVDTASRGPISEYALATRAATEGVADAIEYVCDLMTCEAVDLDGNLRELRRWYQLRESRRILLQTLGRLEGGRPVPELMAEAFEEALALEDGGTTALASYPDLLRAYTPERSRTASRVPTGFATLDAFLDGLPVGGLSIVAGRPGWGKSSFLQQLAEHAMVRGERILIASPEMSRDEITQRGVARLLGVDLHALTQGALTDEERSRLPRLRALPATLGDVAVYDPPRQTLLDVQRASHALALRGPVRLVVVDYVQYLPDQRARGEARYEALGKIARGLKALARTLGCAVVAGAQLGRDAEKEEPRLAHLRESGDLENEADLVLLLSARAADDTVTVRVAKHRQGPTGKITLRFEPRYAAFRGDA